MEPIEFIVHSIPGSPYGRAVLITLEEKGVRCRLAAVAPGTDARDLRRQCYPWV